MLLSQEKFEELTFNAVNSNMSSRAITTIVRDDQGFIWIGTYGDGLYKFDGIDTENYSYNWNDTKSLNSSKVEVLFVDSKNQMWVGTDEGLNLYDRNSNAFISIPFDTKNKKVPVHAIAETDDKQLLIGTHMHGLFSVNLENRNVGKISSTQNQTFQYFEINAILKTRKGGILLGTNKGVFSYIPSENSYKYAIFETLKGKDSIVAPIESMIAIKNKLWLGTNAEGLIEIKTDPTNHYQLKQHRITNKRILTMAQNKEGLLFCGTENDGLFAIAKEGETVKNYQYKSSDKYGLKSNSIWSLFIDPEDRMWVGYYNNGLDVVDKNYSKFKQIESIANQPQSLNASSVTAIAKDKNERLWIGTIEGGVDVYDLKNNTFTHLVNQKNKIAKGLKSLDVQTVFIDSRQNIWVGTWSSGLYFLKNGSEQFVNWNLSNSRLKSNRILTFDEDSKGLIWIGSFGSGVYSYNPTQNQLTHYNSDSFAALNIHSGYVRKLLVDANDHIVLGTRKGLYKIKKTNGSYEVSALNNNIRNRLQENRSQYIITSIFEDSQNKLWLGTDGYGLCVYDAKNENVTWFNQTNGLIHSTVGCITEADNGSIWIGGNRGLSELNPSTQTFINYNSQDGLLSNNFNYNAVFKNSNGDLYFGNYGGINYFNPKNSNRNKLKPQVYLTGLKLFNKPVTPTTENTPLEKHISETQEITLKHDQSVFTIEYVGINYTHTEQNHYAYYLEGFEKTWNYVNSNRTATYTNIRPGTYTFKVKAANNDGVWNETPTTLRIRVLPPWWKRSYCYCTIHISALGIELFCSSI